MPTDEDVLSFESRLLIAQKVLAATTTGKLGWKHAGTFKEKYEASLHGRTYQIEREEMWPDWRRPYRFSLSFKKDGDGKDESGGAGPFEILHATSPKGFFKKKPTDLDAFNTLVAIYNHLLLKKSTEFQVTKRKETKALKDSLEQELTKA